MFGFPPYLLYYKIYLVGNIWDSFKVVNLKTKIKNPFILLAHYFIIFLMMCLYIDTIAMHTEQSGVRDNVVESGQRKILSRRENEHSQCSHPHKICSLSRMKMFP